jgi:hypothetical protein
MFEIVVVGAGNLGARYVEGLKVVSFPISITVIEPNDFAVNRSKTLWNSNVGANEKHRISWAPTLESMPRSIDICIVATSARERSRVVADICASSEVEFWVLEKVLAQSVAQLTKIETCVANSSGCWVNTSRRLMPWHQKMLSANIFPTPSVVTKTAPDWGLACNAIHFLDLVAWWSGEQLTSVNTDGLEDRWISSKRIGYFDILGTLTATFSGGSKLVMKSTEYLPHGEPLKAGFLKLDRSNGDEFNGTSMPEEVEIFEEMELQSSLTAPLIENLIEAGTCMLPTVGESVQLHSIYINALLDHWNSTYGLDHGVIPIT